MSKIYSHLSAEERGVIMAMKVQGSSARHIAQVLERAPSTITRELARNGYKSQSQIGPIGRPRIAGGYNVLASCVREPNSGPRSLACCANAGPLSRSPAH
jgi:hypothetical protein